MTRPVLCGRLLVSGLIAAACGGLAAAEPIPPPAPPKAVPRDEAIRRTRAELEQELKEHGGSWEAWIERLKPYRDDIRGYVSGGGQYKWPWPAKRDYVFQGAAVQLHLMDTFETLPEGERPLDAVVHFHRQLKALGIDLIVAFIPSKLSVHPEYLQAAADGEARPARAPEDRQVSVAVKRLMLRLLEQDVEVVDLHQAFADFRRRHGDDAPLYYVRDGHFVNRGARLAADRIAERLMRYDFVQAALPVNPFVGEKSSRGDGTKADDDLLLIKDKRSGALYKDVEDSPVVVAGDSHLLYNDNKAALSGQIAYRIGLPVTKYVKEGLSREIPVRAAQDPHLRRRRAIVTTYTERMLAPKAGVTRWPLVNLSGETGAPPRPAPAKRPAAGAAATKPMEARAQGIQATGVVTEVSPPPITTGDYPHYLMHLYLTKLIDEAGKPIGAGDGVVTVLAMHRRNLLPIAGARKGDAVSLRVSDWSAVEKTYGKLQTGLLSNVDLELNKPMYWGEAAGQPALTASDLARAGEDDAPEKKAEAARAEAGPSAVDLSLVLDAAIHGKPLHVALARRGGAWKQAFGLTPAYNRGVHAVDASALEFVQGEVKGSVAVVVNPDEWIPKDKRPLPCVLRIQAALRNGVVTGTYAGKAGVQEISGAVSGRTTDPRDGAASRPVTFRMENALTGGSPHHHAAVVRFAVVDGKARGATFGWPPHGDTYFWAGEVTACEVSRSSEGFAAALAVRVSSDRGAVKTGVYRFDLDGKIVGSTLAGAFKATLDGAPLPGGTFIGSLAEKP